MICEQLIRQPRQAICQLSCCREERRVIGVDDFDKLARQFALHKPLQVQRDCFIAQAFDVGPAD